LPLWTPGIDNFLRRLGMPYAMVNAGYLPQPFPAATQFAAVTDVAAVPYLTDKGRELYRKYLEAPFPRVFVINEAGGVASTNGDFDPLGRALGICEQNRSYRCGVYAVDDRVVWKPFVAGPRERAVSIAAKTDQTTMINFAVRLNPDCSPRVFAKFRVVQAAAHGRVDIGEKLGFSRFPADSPFVVCNTHPVQGMAVTYTPTKAFNGEDFFSFAEDGTGGLETVFKLSLTVK